MKMTPALVLMTTVATAAWLGLAVYGRGGFADFFCYPALTVVAIATVAAAIVALFTEGNVSSGEREDRANRRIFPMLALITLLAAYLPAWSDRRDFLTIGHAGVRWVGVVLYIGGGVLRMWPVFVLGKRFSGLVAIQAGHTLVTTGIYRFIRHPSYLGLLVNLLGWALAFRSLIGVLLAALALIPLVVRIRAEEAMLRNQFGSEYDAWCAKTWRLIPGIY
jgi:protein-S-isoprenylcysteine O-methyltransferase Ste14